MPRRNTTKSYKPAATKGTRPAGYKYGARDEETKPDIHDLPVSDLPADWGAPKPLEPEDKREVGLARMFKSAYQHPTYTKDDDGYTVAYQLLLNEAEKGESDRAKLDKVLSRKGIKDEFEAHVLEFIEEGFLVHSHWDRIEADLKAFSKKVPSVLLMVDCIGEDVPTTGCFFRWVVKDGKAYTRDGEIVLPQFDHTQLL